MDKIAYRLGIRRIGWIFTDLIPNDKRIGPGPVLHHRGNMVKKKTSFERILETLVFHIGELFLICTRMYHDW